MKRIIVSIVSEQTVPNYLFIKEIFQIGDELLFISSNKYADRIDWILQTLDYRNCKEERIVFPERGEEKWVDMETQLLEKLSKEVLYVVNLTGGTKYMSLLTQSVFEKYNSRFYYIPYPQNIILEPSTNDAIPLKYRLDIKEYLSCYNVSFIEKYTVEERIYTDSFYERFLHGYLDYNVIDLLRGYRNNKKVAIASIETCVATEKRPQIPNLGSFLKSISFPLQEKGFLTKPEIEFLTGGWFEEYMYYLIKDKIHPQDIKLGVLIQRTDRTNQNDLDVVFMSGNKLFVIECKTGIQGQKMFNETVYKATAIKEAVLGLSANTFVVALVSGDENLKNTAKNMGISYKSREDIETSKGLEDFVNEIKGKAKD